MRCHLIYTPTPNYPLVVLAHQDFVHMPIGIVNAQNDNSFRLAAKKAGVLSVGPRPHTRWKGRMVKDLSAVLPFLFFKGSEA